MNQHHPFHPIIYVRGFAASQTEIEDAVADPYMGFNLGSTKARTVWTGKVKRFFFESPIIRLMSDHEYDDVFVDGEDLVSLEQSEHDVPYRSIVIYRYYDEASEALGKGETPPIEHFAKGLNTLILRLRDKICANAKNEMTPDKFKVYLVAHSMGGLVCRAFLQNPELGSREAVGAVDKVFTYATPHNGIDLRIVRNVPGWATFGDVNNFNRKRMVRYLRLPEDSEDVSVVREFPAERVFNLVGTNPSDYLVLGGISSWAAGDASDGLVRITHATTHGTNASGEEVTSPRAFVHRCHSGHFGIVNSEEGYQNLTRFFFGSLRIDGILDIDDISLPADVEQERQKGKEVRASYQIEVAASIRGCQWQMHRRMVRENSAIFRTYDELFIKQPDGSRRPDRSKSPHLFSVFLDPNKSVKQSGSVSFAFDLNVMVPDYEVDGLLFLKRHYEGGFIFRQLILVEAFQDKDATGGWRIKYGYQEDNPGKPGKSADTHPLPEGDGLFFNVEVVQKRNPGINATLRIEARPWS